MSGLYFTGLGSGLDTDAMVTHLLQVEAQPLQRISARKKELEAKRSCWQEIRGRMVALEQSLQELQSSSLYGQKAAAVDREGLVAVSAAAGAAKGDYRLEIITLARKQSVASSQKIDCESALGLQGTFFVNGAAVVVAESDSLGDLCDRINNLEETGVTAAVIDRRLVLTAAETGANTIDIEHSDLSRALGLYEEGRLNTIEEGRDAEISINGLQVVRSSNVIDDLLEGITLKLERAGEGPVTITVTDDYTSLLNKIENFVRLYNSTDQFIRAQTASGSDGGSRGALYGESCLNTVLSAMRRIATVTVGPPGDCSCPGAIGISTVPWGSEQPEGTLIFDQSRLKEALQADAQAVAALLSGEKGMGDSLGGYIRELTSADRGLLDFRNISINKQLKDLDRRAGMLEGRLEKREQTLRRQFLALERMIDQMNTQGRWLEQQVDLMARSIGQGSRTR